MRECVCCTNELASYSEAVSMCDRCYGFLTEWISMGGPARIDVDMTSRRKSVV